MRNQSLGPLVNGFLWIITYLSGLTLTCQAEIIVDDSLGTPRTELTGPRFAIGAELGKTIERNLFHSFEAFNIGNSERATFTGPSAIQNILSRVTGGSGSTINGVLRSEIQGANLFIMNPAGISFGSGARLEVAGAFHATTADFIRLDDGVRFGALPSPDDALLTTASPAAFGFLDGELDRSQPGQIEVNQASLQNQSVKNLSLVGGPVKIVGSTIIEPDLTLNIVSVGGAGEATISGDLITLQEGQRRGPIAIMDSRIDTTGPGGGHIHIGGGDVKILNSRFEAKNRSASGRGINFDVDNLELNRAGLIAGPSDDAPRGLKGSNIEVTASGTLTLDASMASTRAGSQFDPNIISADAGSITIETGSLKLNNSLLSAENLSRGPGGDITVTATGAVDINDSDFRIRTFSGEAGNVSVTARSLNLTNSATIDADVFTSGAGKIILKAMELISLDERSTITSRANDSGNAGEVSITTGVLNLGGGAAIEGQVEEGATGKGADIKIVASKAVTLSDGAQLIASTRGAGNGGSVEIMAGEVALTGAGSAITTTSEGNATGEAGRIKIEAGRFVSQDGGQVSASTASTGAGGDLVVIADSVLLDGQNSGVSVDSRGTAAQSGNSGNLRLVTNDTLEIRNQARVSADTLGPGAGGDVAIESPDIRLSSGGTISARTRGSGRGGNIEINEINGKSGTVSLSGPSTSISSETTGDGDAGRIAIRTGRLTVRDDAEISASTDGNGRGGSVTIQASNIELLNGGEIEARSDGRNDSAQSGNLSIRADDTIRIFNGSSINVRTEQADAGDIDLSAGFLLHLRENSSITTSVAGGQGNGGNIRIDPVFTVLDGGSSIIANARQGQAGNIRIVSDFFFASPDSIVRASNDRDIQGVVDIESPESDVVSGALALPESFLDAASLLSDRCSARTAKGASSFIVSGRGGVPPGPETVLPSQVELGATPEEARSHDSTSGSLSNTGLALSPVAMGCSAKWSLRQHGFGQRFENTPWQ